MDYVPSSQDLGNLLRPTRHTLLTVYCQSYNINKVVTNLGHNVDPISRLLVVICSINMGATLAEGMVYHPHLRY
jgi:hypothetical protein